MPGVRIAERFPDIVAQVADWNSATGQNLSPQLNGAWITKKSALLFVTGQFNNPDAIGLSDIYSIAGHPLNPSQYPLLEFTQRFYGATHNNSLTAFGILVQNFTNKCGTTSVSHEKS
jgi:hypothetical protein